MTCSSHNGYISQVESNKKESEGNRSTSEEKESRIGQLSNEVKQLQNQVEHFRGTENDIKVGFWLLEMSVIIIFLILRNLTSAMRKPSNCGHYEHCFPQYSKQSEFQSVLEQHRSVKGEVVDNDNKIVEVNLTHQIKDILLDLNKQLSQEQDEHKNTAEQRNQFKVND